MEETFGVDVVVVTPRDDRCDSNSALEDIVTFEDGERGEVAAKAPAEDADTGFVDPAFLAKPTGSLTGILALHLTQIPIGHFLEMRTTTTSATTIETGHDIAVLSQHVEPIVVAVAIAVGDLLVAWSAIDIEEERVLLGAVEVGRQDNVVVELGTQSGGEGAEGFIAHTIFAHPVTKVGIVLESFEELAAVQMERVNRRGVGIGESADVIFAIGTKGGTIPTGFVAQAFLVLTFEINRIELFIEG